MKHILLLGAGRSTPAFIKYFGEREQDSVRMIIADRELQTAIAQCRYSNTTALQLDINDQEACRIQISKCDLVVSMLPPDLHTSIAKLCIEASKHMITASYMSDGIKALHKQAQDAGICLLSEMGVDPGIDHMSAMDLLNKVRSEGGSIHAFESFTGGLPAPISENNPWKYKFTWNPRNVVVAGQGGAVKFIQEGHYKYIPYHKLFRRTEIIDIPGFGKFEGYANRDSLAYREVYGLQDVATMYRGTLRRPGFCRAWNCFVELGATDDSYELDCSDMSYRDFFNTFLAYHPSDSVELKMRQYLKIDQDDTDLWEKLSWLGIFESRPIGLPKSSPARILQKLLEEKWAMGADDRDMIVMWHKLNYKQQGISYEIQSSMVYQGSDSVFTAMAATVGLPLALAARLILFEGPPETGCVLPVSAHWYLPVLKELRDLGISFVEKKTKLHPIEAQ